MKEKKSHTIFILPSDSMGGAENVLFLLACKLKEDGENVSVFFLKQERTLYWRNGPFAEEDLVFTRESSELKGIFILFFQLLYKRKFRRSVKYVFTSHLHLNGMSGVFKWMRILPRAKFIARESTLIFDRFKGAKLLLFRFFYWVGYRSLDLHISQTNLMKGKLFENLALMKNVNSIVLPNPVSLFQLDMSMNNDSVEVPDFKYIVAAGRLISLKGFNYLIKAFSQLKVDGLHLIILGDGPERINLKQLADRLGVGDEVHFAGFVDNPIPYFSKASVCVVSSVIEGFPNVLLQMMFANNAVVSTTCAGGIDQLKGVITCETEDVNSLSTGLVQALKLSDEEKIKNREQFDSELQSRDVSAYIDKIKDKVPKNDFFP